MFVGESEVAKLVTLILVRRLFVQRLLVRLFFRPTTFGTVMILRKLNK